MRTDDLSLPDDMDLLKAMVRAMAEKTAVLEDENAALKARSLDADARIKRLMQILKAYDRARFGRRSEKLGTAGAGADEEAQQAFVFEEIETLDPLEIIAELEELEGEIRQGLAELKAMLS